MTLTTLALNPTPCASEQPAWVSEQLNKDGTPVALVVLAAQIEGARQDGTSFDLVRRGFDALKDCDVPELARLRMKLAAGIVECQLMARLPALAKMFPDPVEALGMRKLARVMTLLGDDELVAAGPLLRDAIAGAVEETSCSNEWRGVLNELLTPTEQLISDVVYLHR